MRNAIAELEHMLAVTGYNLMASHESGTPMYVVYEGHMDAVIAEGHDLLRVIDAALARFFG